MQKFNAYVVIEADNGEDSTVDNYITKKRKDYRFVANGSGNTLLDAINNTIKEVSNQISKWDSEQIGT